MTSSKAEKDYRKDIPVLVAEAQTTGSIAVIRSLGRAGYPVYGYSFDENALGLKSNFIKKALIAPRYRNKNEFIQWLKETVNKYKIRVFIPSEPCFLAIKDVYEEFKNLIPVSKRKDIIYKGLSKYDLFNSFNIATKLKENIPKTILVSMSELNHIRDEIRSLGKYIIVKVDAIHSYSGYESKVIKLNNDENVYPKLKHILTDISPKILVQSFEEGIGVGVFFLRFNNEILARFMHRRIHEVPHTGGASSYRKAWWNQEIYEDAFKRIEHIHWEGVAMFEYRYNPTEKEFYLLELNARFWGSLHLPIFAGIDFPRLLVDAFVGYPKKVDSFNLDVCCRLTFPREIDYVISCAKDRNICLWKRLYPFFEFFILSLKTKTKSDLFFQGDRMLYFHSFLQSVKMYYSIILRKIKNG